MACSWKFAQMAWVTALYNKEFIVLTVEKRKINVCIYTNYKFTFKHKKGQFPSKEIQIKTIAG